ncbi:MAG: hypothetical protein WAL09_00450 [Pseudolabrys sp.]
MLGWRIGGARARTEQERCYAHWSHFSSRNFAYCVFRAWSKPATCAAATTSNKPGPYKPVAISPPKAISEATFEAFRKQINEAAQRKDREALTKLVIGQGFFWLGEKGDRADKRKSGVDNLAAALGLNSKDGAGWDMLASFAEDPTGSP